MQRIILVYGAIAGAIVVALFQLTMAVGVEGNTLGMALGYLSMLIALSLVFVGVKKYRDEHLGGVIRFGTAFGVGLGIAGVACLFYVVGWEAYVWSTDNAYMVEYMRQAVADKAAGGASATEVAAFKAEMDGFAETYANPLYRMLFTLSEIGPIALIVPLVSALFLRRPGFMPARV